MLVRGDLFVGGGADVDAEIFWCYGDGIVVEQVVGGAESGRQVVEFAPVDELAHGVADALRVAAMFEHGDAGLGEIDDADVCEAGLRFHV